LRKLIRNLSLSNISIIILLLIILSIILASSLSIYEFFDTDNPDTGSDNDMIALHAAAIIILTTMLLGAAWYQLHKLSETSKNDFLLRIDREYSNCKIIEARVFIHKLYCQAKSENLCKEKCDKFVAHKINEMRDQEKNAENFICLRNLLDFLETTAYFCNTGKISTKDVEELLGTLKYYHTIFRPLIGSLRHELNDDEFYKELEEFSGKK